MKDVYYILAVNPGSTSTKISLFRNEERVMEKSLVHGREMAALPLSEQYHLRSALVEQALCETGFSMEELDACVGRGGGMEPCESGVYEVNDLMRRDAEESRFCIHPCSLGILIAADLADRHGARAFSVDPPDVDELIPEARLTGLKSIRRRSFVHALNQKEIARRYAASVNRTYEALNLVVAHLGGGISITAHKGGRMIDSSSNILGEGPMAPTRSGTLPAASLVEECFSGVYTREEMLRRIEVRGGWVDHLGTSDVQEIMRRIDGGDTDAAAVWQAFVHQLAKCIGSYSAALGCRPDAILLTGGLAHEERLLERLQPMIGWIAPVVVMPGECEMLALAGGALRVLTNREQPLYYTGVPVSND